MSKTSLVVNAFRRIHDLFPGYFPSTKHDHYKDYGWPTDVTFDMLYAMYRRNGIAKAAVHKIASRTWETLPTFWENYQPTESASEKVVQAHLEKIRAFQAMYETSKRASVGGYAGAILRLADNREFRDPVDTVPGGIEGLVEIVPAWRGQLRVSKWVTDPESIDYGKPAMYAFRESGVGSNHQSDEYTKIRAFDVHPDRVLLWSEDGTVFAHSMLEAGYNDLMDLEKIKGAGGEGFWRNAKASPVIEADAESNLADIAKSMGVSQDEVMDKMNDQVEQFQTGFDKLLFLQGMKAQNTSITLNSPKEFFQTSVQSFAASVEMPFRVLVGNETGERASTEDDRTFSKACMSRRNWVETPMLKQFVERMVSFGVFPQAQWYIGWQSLLNTSPEERMNRAKSMATVNRMVAGTGENVSPVFPVDEIREEAGYKPMGTEPTQPTNEPADPLDGSQQ